MSLELADYETQAREAVKLFWGNREAAQAAQIAAGNQDAGSLGAMRQPRPSSVKPGNRLSCSLVSSLL